MTVSLRRTAVAAALGLALSLTGCGGGEEDSAGNTSGGSDAPRASEKPEETLYGLIQAIADDDTAAACGFIKVEVDGDEYPGDAEEVPDEVCAEAVADFADGGDDGSPGEPGSDGWKTIAEVPIGEYRNERTGRRVECVDGD